MPSTYGTLLRKFWTKLGDDGVSKAEQILKESGCKIGKDHVIHLPETYDVTKHTIGDQLDARTYLIEEWDYAEKRMRQEGGER